MGMKFSFEHMCPVCGQYEFEEIGSDDATR
jgi:hypothetical protein